MTHALRLIKNISGFFRSERGSALPLVGLGIFVLLGATGSAIDLGRLQIVQSRLQQALDTAGLAAGSEPSGTNLQPVVTKYFNANFPTGFMGTTLSTVSISTSSNNMVITLNVSGTMNTTFMSIFGLKTMNVSATSQITKQNTGMELVLVLDNTGSMNAAVNSGNSSTPKITALKTAATELLNILYGSNSTVPNLWVGVVPFTQAVNIGTGYSNWMNTAYANALDFGPAISGTTCAKYNGTAGTYNSNPGCAYTLSGTTIPNFGPGQWSGCVMARPSPYDVTDDTPSTSSFQAYYYAPVPTAGNNYNPWKTSSSSRTSTTTTYDYAYVTADVGTMGPNMFCPQPVQPMVAEESTVLNAINSMTAGGDTDLDLGLVWGWRMLSPNWQGLWGGEMNATGNANFPELPLPYNTPFMQKVVIFMTDGMNRFVPGDYSGYGFLADNQLGSTNELTAEQTLDTRTLDVCTSMKNNGIIIYTIGFGNGSNDSPPTENDRSNDLLVDVPLLTSCATDSNHFFLAPTNAQLESAFQQIANQLANLRVSK